MLEGLFAEEREDERVGAFGQLRGGGGVANHADGCLQAALPSWARSIADEQSLRWQSCSDEHGASDALKVAPALGDADQVFGVLGQIAGKMRLELGRYRMDLEDGELGSRREQAANIGGLAGQHAGQRAVENLGV